MDLIVGIHSIVEAIQNPKRKNFNLVTSPESLSELTKKISKKTLEEKGVEIKVLKMDLVQQQAQREYEILGFHYTRVPGAIFLKCDTLEVKELQDLYTDLESREELKIMALDKVTDVHNFGAIVRTAAFYGMDYILYSKKDAKSFPPSFFRIASGGTEHVSIINVASLPKTLSKLKEKGSELVGFSEHADAAFREGANKCCLVFGAEDTGLSNAVERILDQRVSLKGSGKIKSLNVSVAVAVGLQTFLG